MATLENLLESDFTLDPASPQEWRQFRVLAHRMVDDILDQIASLRDQPVWQPMPEQVRQSFSGAAPSEGEGASAVYGKFLRDVLPYANGNRHPRFWGWVQGQGTLTGMMADMLAAGMNANIAGFNQAGTLMEDQVHAWLAQLMGMPPQTSGVLVSSGTMGNVLAIAVARYAKAREAGHDLRARGHHGLPRMTFYGSTETHGWARKAANVLGLGTESYRTVGVDAQYRVRLDELAVAVAADRARGHLPFCAIGTAGTVNTGATDDLKALAEFCRREGLWFHVDGAFGAFARLSKELAHLVEGIEQADSLACDLHKWMSVNYESAALLVRDPEIHRGAFASSESYLAPATRGVIAGGLKFADRGLDLSRGFKALKAWMMIKAHGFEAFARIVEKNVAQARYLASLVDSHPELELLAPVPLNLVCFRYAAPGAGEERLGPLNQELLLRLHESGIAVPSGTVIGGKYAIRVANCNHRTRRQDIDLLVETVTRLGRDLLGGS